MRAMCRPWGLAVILLASLIATSSAVQAEPGAAVHVNAVVKDGAVRLEARATGPFEYSTSRPSEHMLVVDLLGVSTSDSSEAQILDSDVVSSYRLVPSLAGQKPGIRMEVLLRGELASKDEPKIVRQGSNDLTVLFASAGAKVAISSASNAKTKVVSVSKSLAGFPAIEQIQLAQNGSQTEVRVAGNAHLTYHVIQLSNPDRLVLDFTGARLELAQKSIPSNLEPVRQIRAAQFSTDTARVVIDLRATAKFNVVADGNQVTISFKSAGGDKSPQNKPVAPPVAPKSSKPDKEHVAAKVNLRHAQATAADSAPVMPALPIILPASLTGASSALASPKLAKLDMGSPAQDSSAPGNSAPAANDAPKPAPQAPPASGVQPTGKYSGEPISVNLKDVDLRDFFRLIHEISGLNVVLDPSVKGNLTIVLDEVPWDQALDIVLKDFDLDKQLDGNVLRVATKATLKKEAEQARDLAKAQAEAADTITTTRVLSYAKASDLKETLKKFLSSRGDIISDDRSNTLIIRDIPGTIPAMDNLIRQLDKKSQQVEIEARVVSASRTFSRDIGTQFAFSTSAVNGKNVFGGALGASPLSRTNPPSPLPPLIFGTPPTAAGAAPVTASQPLVTNLAAQAPTSGISYLFSSPNFALDYIITAAESKGLAKLLSQPKIVAQNNQKVSVKQGTKIPVQTVVNNTISVQFVDAVLKLEVTPQITAEGTVFLDVVVENTQIDDAIQRVNGIPALDTQATETKVLIADGGTQVIGGIIISTQKTSIDQVPIVGSIPIIGNLFKHTVVSTGSQELLFFLTPRILPI